MGRIVKKCLACGTLNKYEAEACKSCECVLLADVDQEDEILAVDPMEAALEDAIDEVNETGEEGDLVAQILREQAEKAKEIVAKERAKEERKKKRKASGGTSGFSIPESKRGATNPFSMSDRGGSGLPPQRELYNANPMTNSGESKFKLQDMTDKPVRPKRGGVKPQEKKKIDDFNFDASLDD